MKCPPLLSVVAFAVLASPVSGHSQTEDRWLPAPPPVLSVVAPGNSSMRFGGHPVLRTVVMLAASAGGFALAQSYHDAEPDRLLVPIAAGASLSALAGIALSNAHPGKVILGSALSTLPAGALASYLAGTIDDDEQRQIPLIAFSIPHGLLSSAFAQNRR